MAAAVQIRSVFCHLTLLQLCLFGLALTSVENMTVLGGDTRYTGHDCRWRRFSY